NPFIDMCRSGQLLPLLLLALPPVIATIACGAAAARQPPTDARKAGPPPASADEPLIRAPAESDADVVRAIREHYTKYEYRIPMRDGVHLFTVAYVPKDMAHTYPILLTRTPYSVQPYGADVYPDSKNGRNLRRFAPSNQVIKEGYIIVHQDVRGR